MERGARREKGRTAKSEGRGGRGGYSPSSASLAADVVVVLDGDGDGDDRAQLRSLSTDTSDMLSFQKLDVYRCSIEFVTLAMEIGGSIPRGHAELRDQLRRAALSVPLNIA